MAPIQRGWIGGYVDGIFGWKNGLPAESCNYTIDSIVIPLDGNVEIAADLYQPVDMKPLGTILVRSPYGLALRQSLGVARVFAARGYQVLKSSCRGTFKSTGEFDPARNEVADGHAIVAWMREQSWYTGSFATLGASYLGYVQWALLTDPPPDMKVAVIHTAPHDYGNFIWGAGAFRADMVAWADIMYRIENNSSRLALMVDLKLRNDYLGPVLSSVPLLGSIDQYFGGKTPVWLRKFLSTPDQTDDYWTPVRLGAGLENANIPILLTTGWDDVNVQAVIGHYETLAARGCEVALTVGPWTHFTAGGDNNMAETFSWIEKHLSRRIEEARKTQVRVFVTGAEEWRDLQKWPPASKPLELFLQPGEKLSQDQPTDAKATSTFTFDPSNPTPSIGGPMLFDSGSGRAADNSALGSRSDVLTFQTEALDQDTEILGRTSIELHHSTSHPYADVLVLMSEVDATGKSRSIAEKYVRLDASRKAGSLKLVLADCAHRFRKGNRIRVYIAGGSHPRYIRNLGSGEDSALGTTLQAVEHTVLHNATAISKLVLPVLS